MALTWPALHDDTLTCYTPPVLSSGLLLCAPVFTELMQYCTVLCPPPPLHSGMTLSARPCPCMLLPHSNHLMLSNTCSPAKSLPLRESRQLRPMHSSVRTHTCCVTLQCPAIFYPAQFPSSKLSWLCLQPSCEVTIIKQRCSICKAEDLSVSAPSCTYLCLYIYVSCPGDQLGPTNKVLFM